MQINVVVEMWWSESKWFDNKNTEPSCLSRAMPRVAFWFPLYSERSRLSMVSSFGNGGRMKQDFTIVNQVEKVGLSVVNLNFECSVVMKCQNVTCKGHNQLRDSFGIRNMSFDTLSLLVMVRQLD